MTATAIGTAPRRTRRRILVVEEAPGVRLVTRLVLEAAGYAVVEARDGAVALSLVAAQDQPFDAVLLDLDRHDLSGFDVGGAPIIVCAEGRDDRRPPHAAWLCKPYTPHDLLLVAEVVTSLAPRAVAWA